MQEQIQQKQQSVVEKLIDHLGPEKDEENNLNASAILQDMFETKEFYNILVAQENLERISSLATAKMNESTKASKTCSLTVLNQILSHHIEKLKKKDQNKDENKDTTHDEDDDMIVQQNSEDEKDEEATNPTSLVAQTNTIVEVLISKVSNLEAVLATGHEGPTLTGSVSDIPFVPLGQ